MMADQSENSSVETCSSSEEEIVTDNAEELDENKTAAENIERIVAEHEILEQQIGLKENENENQHNPGNDSKKANGKGKMPRLRQPKQIDVMNMLKLLQSQIDTLKQDNQESSGDDDVTDFKARVMASVNKTSGQGSSGYKKPKIAIKEGNDNIQLSSVKSEQLRSVKTKQLSPAKRKQLSSASNNDTSLIEPKKKKSKKLLKTTTASKSLCTTAQPLSHVDNINNNISTSMAAPTQQLQEPHEDDILQIHLDDNDRLDDSNDDVPAADAGEEALDTGNDEEDDDFDDLVNAIDVAGEEEQPGVALVDTWAAKVNLAWRTKMSKPNLTSVQSRYLIPSNLTDLKVPKMNREMWDMINKWQKKSDLTMAYTQKLLIKSVSAVLALNTLCERFERTTRIAAMRTTIDIVSMLAKVNMEIAQKRKVTIRPCLKGDFKKLSSSTQVTENLFGDTLTQDIKDIQVKRKIEDNYYSNSRTYNSGKRFRGNNYRGGYNNNYNNNNSFLWRGRGRGRPPSYYRAQAPHHQQGNNHHQKKN